MGCGSGVVCIIIYSMESDMKFGFGIRLGMRFGIRLGSMDFGIYYYKSASTS